MDLGWRELTILIKTHMHVVCTVQVRIRYWWCLLVSDCVKDAFPLQLRE